MSQSDNQNGNHQNGRNQVDEDGVSSVAFFSYLCNLRAIPHLKPHFRLKLQILIRTSSEMNRPGAVLVFFISNMALSAILYFVVKNLNR